MQKITFGRFACYLTKSWIESTSGSKPTLFRDFIQRAFITAKQFLGILYTVSIQKFFQVTPKILVHYIGEISLIRIDQLAQFLQRKSGIQKHLTNFQLIKDTFIYIAIHLPAHYSLSGKLFVPMTLGCLEKQVFLPFGT